LQCVEVCCSVLQHAAVCCNQTVLIHANHELTTCVAVLQCIAVCYSVFSVLQCGAACCSVVQCVAVCCSVLQCVAVCCSVMQCVKCVEYVECLQHTELRAATHCNNTLQHTKTHEDTRRQGRWRQDHHNTRHTATLQHTEATHCNNTLQQQSATTLCTTPSQERLR